MPREASSRPQRAYSMREHGHRQSGHPGNFIAKPGTASVWSPAYNGGATTIRPFPVRSPENLGVWDPYRWSSEAGDFGDWIRCYPAIRNFGTPGVTMIIHDPADKSVDVQSSPAWVLRRAIELAVKNRQERQGWAAMLQGSTGKGAELPKPASIYLLQCAIMAFKGKVNNPPRGFYPEDDLIVFALPSSAGESMIAHFNDLNPNFAGQDGDWENQYLHGDPVGINTGRYVTFFKIGQDPRQQQQNAYGPQGGVRDLAATFQSGPRTAQRGRFGGSNEEREQAGYDCYVDSVFNGTGASLAGVEAMISQKVKPWDEILWIPTHEEQAALLADKFPPDMIMYAWADHPHWIPESVQAAAVARHSVAVQGFAGQPGYAPQFGGQPGPGFGQPPHQPPAQFGAPAPQFGAPAPQFGQPAPQFGQPAPQGYPPQTQQFYGGQPSPAFGQPAPQQPGFGHPPAQQPMPQQPQQPQQPFGTPPAGFGQPPAGFQQRPAYGSQPAYSPPPGPGVPAGAPPGFGQPPAGFGQPAPQQQFQPQQPPAQQFQQPIQQPSQPPSGFAPPPGFGQPAPQPQPQQPAQQPWAGGFTNTAAGQAPATTYTPVQDAALPTGGIPTTSVPFDPSQQTQPQPQYQQPYPQQQPQQPQMQPPPGQQSQPQQPQGAEGGRMNDALARARAAAGR